MHVGTFNKYFDITLAYSVNVSILNHHLQTFKPQVKKPDWTRKTSKSGLQGRIKSFLNPLNPNIMNLVSLATFEIELKILGFETFFCSYVIEVKMSPYLFPGLVI